MTIQVESILQEDIGYRESFSIRDEPAPEMDPQDPQVIAPLNGTITITHDPELALSIGNKLWILEHGTITKMFNKEEKMKLTASDLLGHIEYQKLKLFMQ